MRTAMSVMVGCVAATGDGVLRFAQALYNKLGSLLMSFWDGEVEDKVYAVRK